MGDVAGGLVVADTDLVIDFLRGRDPGVGSVRRWLRESRLRLSAVTAFELRIGADFPERGDDMGALLGRRSLPLDVLAALHAGETFARLRAAGLDIGVKDALQAGICRRFDIPLATRNVRHFERVEGLTLAPLDF